MITILRTLLTLGQVAVVRLKPTDVLVIELNNDNVDMDTAERCKKVLREAFGEDRKIVVMQRGMKITIYDRVVIVNNGDKQ